MSETTFQYMQRRDKELRQALKKNGTAHPKEFTYDENVTLDDILPLAQHQSKELIDDNNHTIVEEIKSSQEASSQQLEQEGTSSLELRYNFN